MTPMERRIARLVDDAEMLMFLDGKDEPLQRMTREERRRELAESAMALIREGKLSSVPRSER